MYHDDCFVTLKDEDRGVDWELSIEYAYRPPVAPRMGWQDGGDPGDGDDVDLIAVEYAGGVLWAGHRDRTGIKLPLCLDRKADEHNIVRELRRRFQSVIDEAVLKEARRSWEVNHESKVAD